MAESDWMKLRGGWERLRWARERWQARSDMRQTAKAAAESLGVKQDTYTAYEREPGDGVKHTPLDYDRAVQFGKKFGINWVWLLSGEETPFRTTRHSRIVQKIDEAPEAEQERLADVIEVALEVALRRLDRPKS